MPHICSAYCCSIAGMSRLSQLSVLHVENIQVLGARAFSELQAVIATSPALRFLNINGDAGKTGCACLAVVRCNIWANMCGCCLHCSTVSQHTSFMLWRGYDKLASLSIESL